MTPTGTFFLVLFILILVAIALWIGFTQFRARRLGLPPPAWTSYIPFLGSNEQSPYGPPQPRRGGAVGWIEDRIAAFRQKRSGGMGGVGGGGGGGGGGREATGGYEQGRPLDPDWDDRVPGDHGYGDGGYYNATELEEGRGRGGGGGGGGGHLAPSPYGGGGGGDGGYGGSGYQMNIARDIGDEGEAPRGRSRSREGNPFGDGAVRQDPFGERADPSNMSLRGVSPRPMVDVNVGAGAAAGAGKGNKDGESPTDRKSMFREEM